MLHARSPRAPLLAPLLLGSLVGLGLACAEEAPPRFERIVLVSLDTLRADYLGAYGYTAHETSPTLDAFAAENLRFENAFIEEPRTLTSHMSLFTGLVPHRHGVRNDRSLGAEVPTLAEALRGAGLRTHAIVDGGYVRRRWGFDRGFDGFVEHEHRGFEVAMPKAIQWLRAHRDEPFFLFLHSYDVHSDGELPFYDSPNRMDFTRGESSRLRVEDPAAFQQVFRALGEGGLSAEDEAYVRASYAAGVRYVDQQMQKLLAALGMLGLDDDTLVVIWSDHGEGLFDHEAWSHGELFDHTVRVPLLMRIPGWAPARGRTVRALVSSVDLMPTILALAGVPAPAGIDGRNLLPEIEDPASRERAEAPIFSRKIIGGTRRFAVRTPTHHYIRDEAAGRTWFFDLREDPLERNDLHPSGSEVEARLARRLDAWIAEHDAAGPASAGEEVPLDGEAREQLRALGYLDLDEEGGPPGGEGAP